MANKLTLTFSAAQNRSKITQTAVVKREIYMLGKPAEEPSSPASPVSQRQPDLTATLPALPVCFDLSHPRNRCSYSCRHQQRSELWYVLKHDFLVHLLFQNEPGRAKVGVRGIQVHHQKKN